MANVPSTRSRSMATWPHNLMQQWLDDVFSGFPASLREETEWTPRTDIYEKDNKYIMELDLPGLKREDVQITCTEDMLRITGTREEEKEIKRENLHRKERIHGAFSRQFTLPSDIKTDAIKAHMENGVLKVEMPKTKEKQPQEKQISIE